MFKKLACLTICILCFANMRAQNDTSGLEIIKQKTIHLKKKTPFKKAVVYTTANAIMYFDSKVYEKEYFKPFKKKGVSDTVILSALIDIFNMEQKFLQQDTIMLHATYTNELVALTLIEKKQAIIFNKETNQQVFTISDVQFVYAVNKRLVGEYGKKLYFPSPKKE